MDPGGDEGQSPVWLSAYNHLCLLNLPKQVRELGPPRNRWEGKYMGEGFLTSVKPVLQSANRKNWAKNLMLNLVRQRSLLVLKKKREANTANPIVDDKSLSHLDEYMVYPSRAKLLLEFESRRPLSIVAVEGAELELFSVVRESSTTKYYRFEFSEPIVVLRTSLRVCYYKITLVDIGQRETPPATASAVLLPYPDVREDSDGFFTVIDSNWWSLSQRRTLVQPYTMGDNEHAGGDHDPDMVAV